MRWFSAIFFLTVSGAPAAEKAIDVVHSTITIHVLKAGLLSALGHEHWVAAPIASGTYDDGTAPHIEFKVQAAKMLLKPDPKVNAKDEATIQKEMQEDVLESAKFQAIQFRSSSIQKAGAGWKVEGTLTLHGVSRTVKIDVKKNGDAYAGMTKIKQTDFAIKPATAAGGSIKVKDEIEVAFEIR
jgi:polyisoprenoid-binding protein YceI